MALMTKSAPILLALLSRPQLSCRASRLSIKLEQQLSTSLFLMTLSQWSSPQSASHNNFMVMPKSSRRKTPAPTSAEPSHLFFWGCAGRLKRGTALGCPIRRACDCKAGPFAVGRLLQHRYRRKIGANCHLRIPRAGETDGKHQAAVHKPSA
jgi:hypothetical protein